MSEVQAAFDRLKGSVENALQLANPVQALKEAEHAFMEVLAKAHVELARRVATLESIATSLEPKRIEEDVSGEAESLLHKVEDFVDHLLHPEDAQPEVAQNTGSGASPVAPLAAPAIDSALPSTDAEGAAPSSSEPA